MLIRSLEIKRLYKDLLRYGQQLRYTNKEYFCKRIKAEFKNNKSLNDQQDIAFQYKVS